MTLHLKNQNLNPIGNKYKVTTAFEQPINISPQEKSRNNRSIQVSCWCSPKYSTLLTEQPTAVIAVEGDGDLSQSKLESISLSTFHFSGLRAQLLMTHALRGADLGNLPS